MHQRSTEGGRTAAAGIRDLPKKTRSLVGLLRDHKVSIADYREHLARKYLSSETLSYLTADH
jgi:hypothetical protein